MPIPKPGVLVIGVGSLLREDDAVGIHLVEKLEELFGPSLQSIIMAEPDIYIAERIASCETLIVVDALAIPSGEPFRMLRLYPSGNPIPTTGFVTHVFDWGMILTLAKELYGHLPEAWLLGVRAGCMGIGEGLSERCKEDSEQAIGFLVEFISA